MLRRTLLYVLYVAVIAGLVLVIVVAFRSKPTSAPGTQGHTALSRPKASSGGSSSAAKSGSVASGSGTAAGQNSSSQTSSKNSQALTNTGPGDVAALFGGAALGGALGFSYYQRRKLIGSD